MPIIARTKTARGKHAANARRFLASYTSSLTASVPDDVKDSPHVTFRVKRLLWAQSEIEKALAMETSHRLGDIYSTPQRVIARMEQARRTAQERKTS